ncbi:hypothetical protein [Pyrobaculum calidifontis]|nr:hypothetical protein [Pyrobaculum calidifontis]
MGRCDVGAIMFAGLMLLGAGVGHLLGYPGAGAFIGIGLGYVAMALLRGRAVFLLGLGAVFLVTGVEQLLGLEEQWRTMGALFTVLTGLGFVLWGVSLLRARTGQF